MPVDWVQLFDEAHRRREVASSSKPVNKEKPIDNADIARQESKIQESNNQFTNRSSIVSSNSYVANLKAKSTPNFFSPS